MEHDIYDSLRRTATTCEQLADVLNAIAECCEKVTAYFMDLFEEIKSMLSRLVNSDESRQDDDFSFVTQDMISPILEGKTND